MDPCQCLDGQAEEPYEMSIFSKSVIRGSDHVTLISGGPSSGFTCISYENSDFLTSCPGLIMVYEISICHVLHCPYIPTPISSPKF